MDVAPGYKSQAVIRISAFVSRTGRTHCNTHWQTFRHMKLSVGATISAALSFIGFGLNLHTLVSLNPTHARCGTVAGGRKPKPNGPQARPFNCAWSLQEPAAVCWVPANNGVNQCGGVVHHNVKIQSWHADALKPVRGVPRHMVLSILLVFKHFTVLQKKYRLSKLVFNTSVYFLQEIKIVRNERNYSHKTLDDSSLKTLVCNIFTLLYQLLNQCNGSFYEVIEGLVIYLWSEKHTFYGTTQWQFCGCVFRSGCKRNSFMAAQLIDTCSFLHCLHLIIEHFWILEFNGKK